MAAAICLRRLGFSPYYRGVSKIKHSRDGVVVSFWEDS